MLKFKNLKILLFLMLFAFAGKDALAGKYYSYHIIDVKPSGAGKVYSTSKTENGANTNFNACVDPPYTQTWHTGNSTNTLYLLAKANDGYVFSHWEDQDGTIVASSNPGQVSAHCAQINSDSGPGDYNGTYYAVFVPTQAVEVYTENADFGTASISNSQNEIGQTITLTAHENLFQHAFVGWRKESNGQIVSNENPYTFTITEQTQGKYYAVFRDDYSFYRIKNHETGRYMVATNDQGGITNLSSFSLISGIDNVIYDAGSIVQVRIHYAETTAHTREYAIIVQGEDTQEITGAYLRMDRVEANELTLWEPNADGIRAKDNGGENVSLGLYSSADNTKWFFEKLDLDLEGENYFSLDPAKLVEVDGKYYTTLRTSWNILFNPDQMTPYVVTEVDEVNGTFDMEPITGNIIPLNTPVIIETNSNDVEENRMVPTLTDTTSGTVPSGNLLQHSEKYFPNQPAPVSNCKGLYKNANGQLAFGGDALTTVNGNEAYLSVATEVVLPTKAQDITLAELVRSGNTETLYNITDLTAVDAVDHATMLICKDNNGYASKDENTEQYIDFMHTLDSGSGLTSTVPVTYDQSNWIGLRLPGDAEFTDGSLRNKLLKGVVGRLVNATNPEFVLDKNSLAVNEQGIAAPTSLNPFVAASFYDQNHQTSSVNSKEYFFVQPKSMEMANVEWAQWNGEKFVAPLKSSNNNWNPVNLQGEFEFNGSYLEQGGVFLEDGHVYAMIPAVVKLKDNNYNNYDHVYVLGDVNSQGWSPMKGVEMGTRDGKVYSATVTVNNVNDGNGYFSFTKKLGNDWDGENGISSYRFGAVADGNNYTIFENLLGSSLPLSELGQTKAFEIAAGTYKLVVDLKAKSLVVSVPVQNAPRLAAEGGKQYVVYPLNITKVTTVENGVITAIDDLKVEKVAVEVVYYNLMGVASDKPHHGINIVETRYSDGSRSTVKVLK